MKIKKVAVIGSNSFSGSHFIDYLLSNTNWKVLGISRSAEPSDVFLPYLKNKNRFKRFRFFKFDLVDDFKKISALLDREKPEAVVNFVAQSNIPASWKKEARQDKLVGLLGRRDGYSLISKMRSV